MIRKVIVNGLGSLLVSFSLFTNSSIFIFDGRVTSVYQSVKIHKYYVHTFDSNDNQATTRSIFCFTQ